MATTKKTTTKKAPVKVKKTPTANAKTTTRGKKEIGSRFIRTDILVDEYETKIKRGSIESEKDWLVRQTYFSLKISKIINKKKYYLLHSVWETGGEFFDKYVILTEI